jgi:hypothetical protein
MTETRWQYPRELGDALARFGLAPGPSTPPSVVRDQLNDLYRFELRRMRDALRGGTLPKAEYVDRVVALRKHYWPLTLPLAAWERICGAPESF